MQHPAPVVVIIGGGVAGMTCAHELAERGLTVHVVERRAVPGGKARSYAAAHAGACSGLPAEHGFRFFPSFYSHMDDTLSRIPLGDGVVLDQLVSCTSGVLAMAGRPHLHTHVRLPRSVTELRQLLQWPALLRELGITDAELAVLRQALWRLLTTSPERRLEELEGQTWWDFLECDGRSEVFQKLFATGQIQNAIACKAQEVSARTAGAVLLRLMMDMHTPGRSGDRILQGPTSEVLIRPWLALLLALGVRWHGQTRATGLLLEDRRVCGVQVEDAAGTGVLRCDYAIVALPVEGAAALLTGAVRRLDPALARLDALCAHTAWMVGMQFYLPEPLALPAGHINCIGSAWALTAIAQEQTWPDIDLAARSPSGARGLLSVDISDFLTPARPDGPAAGRPARACTPEVIAAEVWDQLRRFIGADVLPVAPTGWSLDEGIGVKAGPRGPVLTNEDPLFINRAGGWALRPEATTAIPNLLLAGDYLRTATDLTSMEGANESARRAVNALLQDCAHPAAPCELWDPDARLPGRTLRWLDGRRLRRGQPWAPPTEAIAAEGIRAVRRVRRALSRRARSVSPVSTQRWSNLLFAHYPVEAELLQAHLPAPLTLERHDGQAWLTLVAMQTDTLTVPGLGSHRPWAGFSQINVRTYARVGERSGVFFLAVLCERLLASLGARSMFSLPYQWRTVRSGHVGDQTWIATRDGDFTAMYCGSGPCHRAAPGSPEAFLHERYDALSVHQGQAYVLQTRHTPWPLQHARAELEAGPLLKDLGLPPAGAPLLRFSAGVTARCALPQRVSP